MAKKQKSNAVAGDVPIGETAIGLCGCEFKVLYHDRQFTSTGITNIEILEYQCRYHRKYVNCNKYSIASGERVYYDPVMSALGV